MRNGHSVEGKATVSKPSAPSAQLTRAKMCISGWEGEREGGREGDKVQEGRGEKGGEMW